jgi:hypothetical protein
VTWCHIPEERRPHLHHSQNLKPPAALLCTGLYGRRIST